MTGLASKQTAGLGCFFQKRTVRRLTIRRPCVSKSHQQRLVDCLYLHHLPRIVRITAPASVRGQKTRTTVSGLFGLTETSHLLCYSVAIDKLLPGSGKARSDPRQGFSCAVRSLCEDRFNARRRDTSTMWSNGAIILHGQRDCWPAISQRSSNLPQGLRL